VVGVDLSAHGIRDMIAAAKAEELPITGEVADVKTYTPDGLFDVMLIDRTLHMLPTPDQRVVLATLIHHITPQGWLLIADEASNMHGFRDVMAASGRKWTITKDGKGMLFAQSL